MFGQSKRVKVTLTIDCARYVRRGDRYLRLAAMLGVTQVNTTCRVQSALVIEEWLYTAFALRSRVPICREWESHMKYELPKSYAKRTATNTSPPTIMSHPNSRLPADFRPRPARSTAPSPLSTSSPAPHAVERARTQPSPTTPPSFTSTRQSDTTPETEPTYQRLLV